AKGEPQLIDVYDGAKPMTRKEAEERVLAITEEPLREEHLAAVTKKAIVVRMLHNLLGVARGERDEKGMLRYADAVVTVAPDSGPERWMRAVLRYRAGDKAGALGDADWLLDHKPKGVDLDQVENLRKALDRPER